MNTHTPGRRPLVTLLVACAVAAALGVAAGALWRADSSPGDDSPEVGFARDMQVHHAQAVEMATVVRDRTEDLGIRTLAYDILTSQQQQIGQMYAWIRSWDLPQLSDRTAMVWMSGMDHSSMPGTDSGHAMAMSLLPDGRMPGMASPAEMEALRSAKGRDAEVRFLRLMIVHHQSGVMMAQAAVDLCEDEQVLELARSMAAAQTAEIRTMTEMLAERGATAD